MFEQIETHKDRVISDHILPETTWQTRERVKA
jgi:hypothetical protein